MNQLAQIEKAVRVGVLDVLEADGGRLTMTDLVDRVDAAADIDDVSAALRALMVDRLVIKSNGRYRVPQRNARPGQKARDAGPQPVARKPADAVEAVVAAHGDWMTPAEVQPHVSGLELRQIHDALRANRFVSRRVERGGKACKAYRLRAEGDGSTETAWKRHRLDRCVRALDTAGRWATAAEIAGLIDEPIAATRTTLKNGVYREKIRASARDSAGYKLYGLPDWSLPDAGEAIAAPDNTADIAPCYGLFSDGRLSIESAAGAIDLAPAETAALVAYLVRQRSQIQHVFDAALDGADRP